MSSSQNPDHISWKYSTFKEKFRPEEVGESLKLLF